MAGHVWERMCGFDNNNDNNNNNNNDNNLSILYYYINRLVCVCVQTFIAPRP